MKLVTFLGDSRTVLQGFPDAARERLGRELLRVQRGDDPVDWKPMSSIGPGVRELRARDEAGIFRLIYVAKIADRIFVLHCFQKKTQRTAKPDLALAAKRYAELLKKEKNG